MDIVYPWPRLREPWFVTTRGRTASTTRVDPAETLTVTLPVHPLAGHVLPVVRSVRCSAASGPAAALGPSLPRPQKLSAPLPFRHSLNRGGRMLAEERAIAGQPRAKSGSL
jgi:hypothetical protein